LNYKKYLIFLCITVFLFAGCSPVGNRTDDVSKQGEEKIKKKFIVELDIKGTSMNNQYSISKLEVMDA
jgi:hypothetical protein